MAASPGASEKKTGNEHGGHGGRAGKLLKNEKRKPTSANQGRIQFSRKEETRAVPLRAPCPPSSAFFVAPKRKDRPANRRPFLSRENSSNGGKAIRTFWTKSYGRAQGVSSEFSDANALKNKHLGKMYPASKMWQLLPHFPHCT